ncbi:unnamed protein product [Clavelina lepadiformis]|uniref:Uncharacterized protein n=1 Tax=Clavelina lepadiformis TaxID=159417 RepID=A0ABP0GM09_CLALP
MKDWDVCHTFRVATLVSSGTIERAELTPILETVDSISFCERHAERIRNSKQFTGSCSDADDWKSLKLYIQEKWDNYEIASGLKQKTAEVRVVTFLVIIGKNAITFPEAFLDTGQEDIQAIKDGVKEHFKPEINLTYERQTNRPRSSIAAG